MIKVECKYRDGSQLTYSIKNSKGFLVPKYANRHVKDTGLSSIIVHNFPLKDNEPLDQLKDKPEYWDYKGELIKTQHEYITNQVKGMEFMNCITRKEMKFGEYSIPARTKAVVINTPQSRQSDVPGLDLKIYVSLWDMAEGKDIGIPVTKLQINNELENVSFGNTDSQMTGIVITTDGKQVFLDAGDNFYFDAQLRKWHMNKIFGEIIPEQIERPEYSSDYLLRSVLEYLDNEFAEWVQDNCDMRKLTKRDIENNEGFDGAAPGDRILSTTGLKQFHVKLLEYQNRLETTGFTYEFKGGLYWD